MDGHDDTIAAFRGMVARPDGTAVVAAQASIGSGGPRIRRAFAVRMVCAAARDTGSDQHPGEFNSMGAGAITPETMMWPPQIAASGQGLATSAEANPWSL
ncbi:hypothetical protein ABZ468_27175 [Streptomyces sp. NPDC005708]|uniref:hypothetical protein n=1 Tax=unclassified Streptomyces TaxID=2593676 RepID=UPI0033F4E6A6